MSDPRKLIARDVPIPKGTVLEVEVTFTYLVPLTDDWGWDDADGPLTLDAVEKTLGEWEIDRARELARNYDQSNDPCIDEWVIVGLSDARFESEYERAMRNGTARYTLQSFDVDSYIRPPKVTVTP